MYLYTNFPSQYLLIKHDLPVSELPTEMTFIMSYLGLIFIVLIH